MAKTVNVIIEEISNNNYNVKFYIFGAEVFNENIYAPNVITAENRAWNKYNKERKN